MNVTGLAAASQSLMGVQQRASHVRQRLEPLSSRSQRTGATQTFPPKHQRSVQNCERRPSKRPKRETQYRTHAGALARLEQDRLLGRRHHDLATGQHCAPRGATGQASSGRKIVRKHPDNSGVRPARRDDGLQQDIFLTGAALGVHCNTLPLSFFPEAPGSEDFLGLRTWPMIETERTNSWRRLVSA
jgi:hypothetical protein